MIEDPQERTVEEWTTKFNTDTHEATAAVAAKFMVAMSYYHDRMKLHIVLHPFFYLAGFLTGYFLVGRH